MSSLIVAPEQIWLVMTPIDMRRGIDGLSAMIQQSLGQSALCRFGVCLSQSRRQSLTSTDLGWQWRVAVSASLTSRTLYLAESARNPFFAQCCPMAVVNHGRRLATVNQIVRRRLAGLSG